MKILIVDDSATMRRIIGRTLASLDYTDILEAEHGKEALEQIEGGDVELVITDWNMPVMNGLKLIKEIRAGAHSEMPILMVTTNGAKGDVMEALSAGVNNYVIKPMTADVLKEKIIETIA